MSPLAGSCRRLQLDQRHRHLLRAAVDREGQQCEGRWRWGLQSLSLSQALSCTNPMICDANPRRKASQGWWDTKVQKEGRGGLFSAQLAQFFLGLCSEAGEATKPEMYIWTFVLVGK